MFILYSNIDFDSTGTSATKCATVVSLVTGQYETSLSYTISADAYDTLVMTCTSKPLSPSACFSPDTTVEVQGKGHVRMVDLQVGDHVRTVSGNFQPVYSFGHKDEHQSVDYIQLYTAHSDKPLELSGQHLVFVDETSYLFGIWAQPKAIRADHVQVGDMLLVHGQRYPVTKLGSVTKTGAYMPLTPDGSLLVHYGVHASAYVSGEDTAQSVVDNFAFYWFSEQNLMHWWLSPYRMLCMGVSSSYFTSENPNMMTAEGQVDGSILKWLKLGLSTVEAADEYSFLVHHLMGIPVAIVFACFMLVEGIFGATMAPTAILMAIGFYVCYLAARRRHQA